MNKYNKLAKNTCIFFVANFSSRVLTFLLVRFYTEFLSTQQFGIIDIINTTSSLSIPIITLCITEAVLRFSIDDSDNRGKILTNGLFTIVIGNLLFVFTTPILCKFDLFRDNIVWLYLLTITNSLYITVIHFARGIGKTKLFACAGVIHTILQISLNILFLAVYNLNIKGYFIAIIISNIITTAVVFFYGSFYEYMHLNIDGKYYKDMLIYSIPLIPNSIFWWMMGSADKYIINIILTSSENGLYAVANKIPTIITTISSIFFQAWQLSSVEEANSNEKNVFYSNVFKLLSSVMFLAASFVITFIKPLYVIMAEKSFHGGLVCVPFLLCATVFSSYSSFLGVNYVAMKKTKNVFFTTLVGAAVNIILNPFFTKALGIKGTALATMIAFIATWITRAFDTRCFVKIHYSPIYFWIPAFLLVLQSTVMTFITDSIFIQLGFFAVIFVIYFKFILNNLRTVIAFVSNKVKGVQKF